MLHIAPFDEEIETEEGELEKVPKENRRIIAGCRCNTERYYANMPLSDIVVCIQLHINYIYGSVRYLYSFLDAYEYLTVCVL